MNGHVHLRVTDINPGIKFYTRLSLRITGELIVALNTWPIPPLSTGYGLLSFSIVYPDRELLRRALINLGIDNINDNVIKNPYEFHVELTYE